MTDDGYDPQDDLSRSWEAALAAVRERIAAGGEGWVPKRPAKPVWPANEKGRPEGPPPSKNEP